MKRLKTFGLLPDSSTAGMGHNSFGGCGTNLPKSTEGALGVSMVWPRDRTPEFNITRSILQLTGSETARSRANGNIVIKRISPAVLSKRSPQSLRIKDGVICSS